MTTTDTPSPLTPLDERRLAVLGGVVQAVCVDGRTATIEVQALADWVLQGSGPSPEELAAERAARGVALFLDGSEVAPTAAREPVAREWVAGDVVRLNRPSPNPRVADLGQGGWKVTADPRGRLMVFGRLQLRHEGLADTISRDPSQVTLVTPAGAPS